MTSPNEPGQPGERPASGDGWPEVPQWQSGGRSAPAGAPQRRAAAEAARKDELTDCTDKVRLAAALAEVQKRCMASPANRAALLGLIAGQGAAVRPTTLAATTLPLAPASSRIP